MRCPHNLGVETPTPRDLFHVAYLAEKLAEKTLPYSEQENSWVLTLGSGVKLGRYEIRSKLGAGGMGEVYLARDLEIGRNVAVKVLPSTFSDDKDRLHRFQQEACAAGALNHPNILSIYDVGKHDSSPYVVSELLEGETLRKRIGGTPLGQRRAIDYALQIAYGLAAAHEKGIIHRDLKPDNLFITNDGRVKILDFGLAKLTQLDGATRRVSSVTLSRKKSASITARE